MDSQISNRVPMLLREANRRFGIFTRGETVVVAASGGPDSTALLHALCASRAELSVQVVSAHLNHGFRGDESDGDARYVRAISERLGIDCHEAFVDVPAMKLRQGISSQQAARDARLRFLEETRMKVGALKIATGHTGDDRIETVLLNVLRGCGIDGLGALPAVNLPFVRPLILVSRVETRSYCDYHNLDPRTDSSNLKADYRRNRLRSELLPLLSTYYNEKVGEAVLRLSDLAAEDAAALELISGQRLSLHILREEPGLIELDAAELGREHLAIRRRMIRLAIERVRGVLRDIDFGSVSRIVEDLNSRKQNTWILPALEASGGSFDVFVRTSEHAVTISREANKSSNLPWRLPITIPGVTEITHCGVNLHSYRAESVSDLKQYVAEIDGGSIIIDAGDVNWPVVLRSWRPGDRFRPKGMAGLKKIQDLFTDRKIPREIRSRVPILVDSNGEGEILAVLGHQSNWRCLNLNELDALEELKGPDVSRAKPAVGFVVFHTSLSESRIDE